jgi:hypothetical protein
MGDFNVGLRLKYEQQCPDCGQSDFVEDHASGDLVCRVRGLLPCACCPGVNRNRPMLAGSLTKAMPMKWDPACHLRRPLGAACCRIAGWWWRHM